MTVTAKQPTADTVAPEHAQGLGDESSIWFKLTGCTVHIVRPEVDSGPIIAQAGVPVLDTDTADSLGARVLEAEHMLYPHALSLFASGAITVAGDRTMVRQAAVNQAKPLYWPPID